jgi:hypothetical protein
VIAEIRKLFVVIAYAMGVLQVVDVIERKLPHQIIRIYRDKNLEN